MRPAPLLLSDRLVDGDLKQHLNINDSEVEDSPLRRIPQQSQ